MSRGLQRSGCGPYPSSAMEKVYPLIEHYGYLIIFFGGLLGTTGIPFPSAAILLASGVLIQQDHLDLKDAILFGILGAIIGNQIGYRVGHRAGRPFVLKWGRYVRLTLEHLERVEHLFARHGGKRQAPRPLARRLRARAGSPIARPPRQLADAVGGLHPDRFRPQGCGTRLVQAYTRGLPRTGRGALSLLYERLARSVSILREGRVRPPHATGAARAARAPWAPG